MNAVNVNPMWAHTRPELVDSKTLRQSKLVNTI